MKNLTKLKEKKAKYMKDFKFDLGDEVFYRNTRLKGIIKGRTQYFTGNVYGVQYQKLSESTDELEEWEGEWNWFDEDKLILIRKGAYEEFK